MSSQRAHAFCGRIFGLIMRSLTYSIALATFAFTLAGCEGAPKKAFEGGTYQQLFLGGKVIRQTDFPSAEMCSAGLRGATPGRDMLMSCSPSSLKAELPYSGRVVNAGWGLDAPIHFRVREACVREAASVGTDVVITCPATR